MTDQDTTLKATEPDSQVTVADLQKKLDTVTQAQKRLETSFKNLQSAKDREVAAANKRVQNALQQREETQKQILALTDDPVAKRDLILQQKEAELQQYRQKDTERTAAEQMRTEYVEEWDVPAETFAGLDTRREVYDAAKEYHKKARITRKKTVEAKVVDTTPASTAPSTAPSLTTVSVAEREKRITELKTIIQSTTATKKVRKAAQQEFMKLRRPVTRRGRQTQV